MAELPSCVRVICTFSPLCKPTPTVETLVFNVRCLIILASLYFVFSYALTDKLITIDPHIHRYKSLKDIFTIPAKNLTANSLIAAYIKKKIKN